MPASMIFCTWQYFRTGVEKGRADLLRRSKHNAVHAGHQGLHGLSSNHAIRGLQRVEHGVSSLALSKGAPPRAVR